MSPFPVCADEHVTSPLGLARINASKPNFNHIALFSWALLSSPPPLTPPPRPCPSCLLPLTLVVKRSKPFLKKSKPSCLSRTSRLGRRLSDRPHCTADVKTQNIVGPHRTCLTLPSPTVPRSGLLKSWKGFWDVYRNICFLLCTFSALFRLRLARSPFFICPF